MSGDHRKTSNHNKKLLTNIGFKQYKNTTLFSKEKIILSPAVAKNQQGYYWFDIREAIISQYNPDQYNKFMVVVRVIPNRFIAFNFLELKRIMDTESKTENKRKKVWSFVIDNGFTVIKNKKSGESIEVCQISEKELLSKLQKWDIE